MPPVIFVPATAAPDAGPDVARQTSLTLARLGERLRAERSSLADAAAITVYLRQASDFAAMNDAAGRVTVVLDAGLMEQPRINFHPLRNTMTTTLARDALMVELCLIRWGSWG